METVSIIITIVGVIVSIGLCIFLDKQAQIRADFTDYYNTILSESIIGHYSKIECKIAPGVSVPKGAHMQSNGLFYLGTIPNPPTMQMSF